ncbi:MAG: glycosyltransferase family 9 protein, partial [Acidobacteria bacterium]|nr:glycosyltransferase family 9 protein [Acidobacteriota bacterium]
MNILVRGTNWIGDAVMSVPALRRLRTSFPGARITLLTRKWAAGIFDASGFADEIVTFDPEVTGPVALSKIAGKQKFDVGLLLPNSFSAAFSMRLAGTKRRFGYATEHRGFLLTDTLPVPQWKDSRHESFYYVNLVAAVERSLLGQVKKLSLPDISLVVSDSRRQQARKFLIDQGVVGSRPIAAIAAGSTNSGAKRWGAERYAALNDLLQTKLGVNVVLLGSAAESDVSQKVVNLSDHKPIDLTGKTSLAAAAAILAEIDLLVANDIGLAHLAPAVNTKTVIIFG